MKVTFSSVRKLEPDAEHGLKIPYAPAKRVASKMRWYLVLLIVCSPLLFVVYNMLMPAIFTSEPGYISLEKLELNSDTSGRVARIDVAVGEDVHKGMVIGKIVDADLESRIRQVQAELNAHQALMVTGRDANHRKTLQEQLDLARSNSEFYRQQYAAMRTLFARRSATRADLNNAQTAHQRAQLTVLELEESLTESVKRPTGNSVEIERLKAELSSLHDRRTRMLVRSPAQGRILDVFVREDQIVRQGDQLALLGKPSKAKVIAYLDPKYAKFAQIGQPARIELPDGQNLSAHIIQLPEVTHRLPSEFARPLGLRTMKILAHLEFDEPLPVARQVEGLPVTVRFPFRVRRAQAELASNN